MVQPEKERHSNSREEEEPPTPLNTFRASCGSPSLTTALHISSGISYHFKERRLTPPKESWELYFVKGAENR